MTASNFPRALGSNRIDHFKKWELIEIRVSGADSSDPVLAHENGGVRVMEEVAGKVWHLHDDFSRNISMSIRWGESA
jgi:hypothetical protein